MFNIVLKYFENNENLKFAIFYAFKTTLIFFGKLINKYEIQIK